MIAVAVLVLVVWLIDSGSKGEMGQAQWAGVGVVVALLATMAVLSWTERDQ